MASRIQTRDNVPAAFVQSADNMIDHDPLGGIQIVQKTTREGAFRDKK